jgi:hypothetical protein
MPRACIFCDNPLTGVRAKEHVVPQWLMAHLGMTEDQLYLAVAQSADDTILESRQQVASNFVEGRVCGACNNGWMNNLEIEAMEILKPLIAGTVSLVCISDAQRTIVAKWATKTAYAVSHAAPLKKTPDPSQLHYMKENLGAVPPRVGIFGCQYPATADFRQIQRNHWHHLTNRPPVTPIPPAGTYKIALQFRCLMLLVAHWSDPLSVLMIAPSIHIPLWPQSQVNIAHHVQLSPLNMSDPMAPLDRFCSALSVCDADFPQT